MSARDQMLAAIRRSLGVSGSDVARRAAVNDRLARAPKGVIPARGNLAAADRVMLFADMARAALAELVCVSTEGIPDAVAQYLTARRRPLRVCVSDDARLAGLDWDKSGLDIIRGGIAPDDLVAISHAEAGVAETGTLMLLSGPDNPTLFNFLPDTHIVVVAAEDIVGDTESALERVTAAYGKGRMPRLVNFITGPSRSGDIEQTMYLGAHGPRELLILVVG